MVLNKTNLVAIKAECVEVPSPALLQLPEKVLQFGTGVLLRGLPDYFIDKANKKGIFNGRVVVVKSTDSGGVDAFAEQDGLYTICVKGIEDGHKVEENIISTAISRVLSAKSEWKEILQCAHNADLQTIISNTTEVGIQLVEESINQQPPASFPAKLLAFLYERYKAFNGSAECGMIIIPTELIVGNGDKLREIVLKLAHFNKLEKEFLDWLQQYNIFCNSLVDRIVPGKPEPSVLQGYQTLAGYTDELLIMSEVYRLWAIEGNGRVKQVLSFAAADKGVIITPDIEAYRELKLRLLNGTHTLSCGLAFLAGFETVKDAMENQSFNGFVQNTMLKEIAPSIPGNVTLEEAEQFGRQVLDRFRNPFIKHQWISITMQYTSKMKMRVVPVLRKYVKEKGKSPEWITAGFAAYLLFTKPTQKVENKFYGSWNDKPYPINDDHAAYFFELWQLNPRVPELVQTVLKNTDLWGTDLSELEGFQHNLINKLQQLIENGPEFFLVS